MKDFLLSIYSIAFVIAILLFVFLPRRRQINKFFNHDLSEGPKSYHLKRLIRR